MTPDAPGSSTEETPDRRDERLRDRFEQHFEQPIARVTSLTKDTLALFPTRVWRRFLAGNGFLLSSGMSYQALFAVFAAVYVIFAVAGLWLVGSPDTMDALIRLINTYVPGLIGDDGVIPEADLRTIATSSMPVLTITGVVALGVLVWTAIGWLTYSRLAVRAIFGLPKDRRNYVLLKARDFMVSFAIGLALFVAAVVSVASTTALDWLFSLFGDTLHDWSTVLVTGVGLVAVFVIDTGSLMMLFRFLADARLTLRRMLGGSMLGGFALVVLQVLGSQLLGGATRNPLLSTFVVFIAMLLWFRLWSIVTLVAAAWIAVAAEDRHVALYEPTPEELAALEHDALVLAAQVRLRVATAALETAGWLRRPAARWRRDAAQEELDALNKAGRPATRNGSLFGD